MRIKDSPFTRATRSGLLVAAAAVLGACNEDGTGPDLESFTLMFGAVNGSSHVECGDVVTGLGPSSNASVELNDLRFYISNLEFFDENGAPVEVVLDENDFQHTDTHGSVALVDLTGTTGGACSGTGFGYFEGTARTNAMITGETEVDEVHSIAFDVGIPQMMMKHVIADHTEAGAPSPFAEMHWSWAFAYRFFVMNFALDVGGTDGEGYVHVGSTDCGGDGTKAMTDVNECGLLNTARVEFDHFHLDDMVGVDIGAILAGVDFMDGGVPGIATHSGASQPDTPLIFDNFGIDVATGASTAAGNSVFVVHSH